MAIHLAPIDRAKWVVLVAWRHKRGAVEGESQRARMQPFRPFHLLPPSSSFPHHPFVPIIITITTLKSHRLLYQYHQYLYTFFIWTMHISL